MSRHAVSLALLLLLVPGRALAQGDTPAEPAATPPTAPATAPAPAAPPAPPPPVTPPPAPAKGGLPEVHIEPFATIVGGLKADTIIQDQAEHRESRLSAIAITDFGLRGKVASIVTFVSELMANGGTDLHGSSAWEGQAALQVRRQLVRVEAEGWMGEVGRIIDEASLNYVSAHVGDTLFQDTATRDPLLYSGFNLGNGLRATYEPVHGLRVGVTFNAGNPTSTSAALQVGGSFPPFPRFYIQPFQAVQQSAQSYPDDTFHMMMLTPSVMYADANFEARVAFQGYTIDTNTNSSATEPIRGYNARGTVKVKILDEMVVPFGSIAMDRNDTVQANDSSKLAPDKYTSITWGAGFDVNLLRVGPDKFTGLGAQYDRVQYQVGNGDITNLHYINVGATYWFNTWLAAGARFAMWIQNQVNVHDEGERSALLTLRLVL